MTEGLQDFIETVVSWMRHQYQFDPVEVEISFGQDDSAPAWAIPLGNGSRLELRGRIDRVDLCHCEPATKPAVSSPSPRAAWCVVVDYKSSQKQLDPVLVANGLQLQLLAYLNVLRRWPNPEQRFGVQRLIPAGVFYVNLRGKYGREPNRLQALANDDGNGNLVYRHTGRFDASVLRRLDARPDAQRGDQFNYRLTASGRPAKNCAEPLATHEFEALLNSIESQLKDMGDQIFAGQAEVAPYRHRDIRACDQCFYQPICRVDPWTHRFRILQKSP